MLCVRIRIRIGRAAGFRLSSEQRCAFNTFFVSDAGTIL